MKNRTTVTVLLCVLAVAIILRVSAPVLVEYHLNENLLADLGAYSGSVEDVDFVLWRALVRIEGLHIEKTTGHTQVDFLIVPLTRISLSRRALLKGAMRAEAIIVRPELNFVDAERKEDRQAGLGLDLRAIPKDILKFTVEEVAVRQGKVAFRNFTSEPPVNLQIRNIDLVATNLTNVQDEDGPRVATAQVTAEVFDDSPLSAEAEFDPFDFHSFIFAGEMTLKDLTALNPLAQAYANLDFNGGRGEMVMELQADDGTLTGYVKPAFENVDIADWEQDVVDQGENPFRVVWEGLVGTINAIVSNPKTDKTATRIEISGEIPDTAEVDMWGAIFGIVRNAFAETLNINFDDLTTLSADDDDDDEEQQNQAEEEE